MKLLAAILGIACAVSTMDAADWTLSFSKKLAELPGGAEFIEREAQRDGRAVRIQGVFFRAKDYVLEIVDNPVQGKGSLGGAMQEGGFVAGVNGGYFHPDFRPLGLLISGGRELHGYERAKLLSGILSARGNALRLMRASEYQPGGALEQALQAGPFLVDGGRAVTGLEGTRSARRTVVATDGHGGWALLMFSSVTLADAAQLLSSATIFPNWKIERALNLDGGSSSALWVATEPKPFYLAEFGTVRNYVGIRPR